MTAKPQLPERTPRAKGEPTALDGLLVVDFTRVVAGPACTQTLADFGAEVIKIENPDGGDDTRHYEHAEIGGESAAFLSLNRNKRGIALDFNNPVALEVARELIAKADVVVENFSGGIMKKFGLDYASVGPEHAWLRDTGRTEYAYATDAEALEGFKALARLEGIIPALESSHAVSHAMRLAPTMAQGSVMLVNLSGRGDKDVQSVAEVLK